MQAQDPIEKQLKQKSRQFRQRGEKNVQISSNVC